VREVPLQSPRISSQLSSWRTAGVCVDLIVLVNLRPAFNPGGGVPAFVNLIVLVNLSFLLRYLST